SDRVNSGATVGGELADHGGGTETLALLGGSAALGLGVPAWCPQRDQRGALRRVPCDSGAVEAVPVPEAGTLAGGGAPPPPRAPPAACGRPAARAAAPPP